MDKLSNRQKRKLVSDGVRKLKAQPGWDPSTHVRETAEEAMQRLDQESRSDQVYTVECAECARARADSADPSALCDAHLAAAMGF